jgi:hypothetical protein
MNRTLLAFTGCSLLGILSASCSKSDRAEFGPERRMPQGQRPTKFGASTDERLGTNVPSGFTADTPPGWSPLPSRKFRDLNYQVAGNPDAECYLSAAGINGSLEMNLNRWLDQFGLAPGAVPIGKPDQVLMGKPAVLVSMEGTFLKNKGGWALLGLIAQSDDGGLATLKMTGPKDVVLQQRDAFLKLAKSIKGAAAPGGDAMAVPGGSGPKPRDHDTMPADHGAMGKEQGGLQAGTVPAGWSPGQVGGMRVLDYRFGGDGQCYVTVLGGPAAADIRGNVNRWRGELQLQPIDNAALAALPKKTLLGAQATLFEGRGHFTGSGRDVADAIVLAAMIPAGEQTLFVKMVGPAADVEAQRKAFDDFCTGLKW